MKNKPTPNTGCCTQHLFYNFQSGPHLDKFFVMVAMSSSHIETRACLFVCLPVCEHDNSRFQNYLGFTINVICDVACQNKAFVAEISCSVVFGKECNFRFHMIYYLCVYALPVQSYAPRNKL